MTRRRKTPPKPRHVDGALIVVSPGPGVVERTAQAVEDARQLAEAKRIVERRLMAAGLGKRQAGATVAGMRHVDLLAEAERVRVASDPADAIKRPHRLIAVLAALMRWLHLALKEIST